MGQYELLQFLKKKDDWMLAVEIRKDLNITAGGANRLIKLLLKSKLIKAKLAKDVIKNPQRLKKTTIKARAFKAI